MRISSPRILLVLSSILLGLLFAGCARAQQPAVLIVSPQAAGYYWVDLDYLAELQEAGFEVDYTDTHSDFTWERVKQYNVLVIYTVPPEQGVRTNSYGADRPPYQQEYMELVNRFLQVGGGML